LDCTAIVVSQLSRGDKDLTREPQPSDLRESGALEQDADVIAMLHPYDPRAAATLPPPPVIPMKVLFKKNRGGEMGVACLDLERELVRFIEAQPPLPIAKAESDGGPKKKRTRSPATW
jgi:replicative DNA helicase